MNSSQALATTGQVEDNIRVSISYSIIELFSKGLYSSPTKAVEELVSNSYDANATAVSILMPRNINASDASIIVVDDGISMDRDGLKDLWLIARSRKRDRTPVMSDRLPIGKFGIGKLATYVLARQLTYICHVNDEYLAVTMDYSKIDEFDNDNQQLELPLRKLTVDEAIDLLKSVVDRRDEASTAIQLFGPGCRPTWTVAIMSNLTPLAQSLREGRLKWVLSTALPINPQFTLYYNGELVEPSKLKVPPMRTWTIGVDDETADKQGISPKNTNDNVPYLQIDDLGLVSGYCELYEDPLTGGKSADFGRSHGIFVMVRNRLINMDDALFGLPQLSHGPFSRFRMVLHADCLDYYLRSSRETVQYDAQGVRNLQIYIQAKFNEVRAYYNQWATDDLRKSSVTNRILATSGMLTRKPIVEAICRVVSGDYPALMYTQVPVLDEQAKQEFRDQISQECESEFGLIRTVEFEPRGINMLLARYDPTLYTLYINILHPYFANYIEGMGSREPFEITAVTEVFLEAYLIEEGMSHDAVKRIVTKRDKFLRELVYNKQASAPLVASKLEDCRANSVGLEDAVADALSSIGFEVARLGGKGKPDGLASAYIGIRDTSKPSSIYTITYDAKSTGKDAVSTHTVGTGTLRRHREAYKADYSLVVAPNFRDVEDGALDHETKQQDITCVTVDDLIRLLYACATRQVGYGKLRDLFIQCRMPGESKAWIDNLLTGSPDNHTRSLEPILEVIYGLQKASPDPVKIAVVAYRLRELYDEHRNITEGTVKEWVRSIRMLVPNLIEISEPDIVYLEQKPSRILNEIQQVSNKIPHEYLEAVMKFPLASIDVVAENI